MTYLSVLVSQHATLGVGPPVPPVYSVMVTYYSKVFPTRTGLFHGKS